MADDSIKLPRSSYEEIVRVLRAYLSAGENADQATIAKQAALNRTVVSRNNAFLIHVGLIEESGRSRHLSPVGSRLAHALEHDQQEDIQRYWRETVEENEFLSQIVSAVRIRNGMDDESLHSHIAYTAGEKKTKEVMTGARTVTAILVTAGLLLDGDGGRYEAVQQSTVRSENSAAAGAPSRVAPREPGAATGPSQRPSAGKWSLLADSLSTPLSSELQSPVGTTLAITIQIQCSPNDVEELGPKLRKLLDDLAQEVPNSDTDEQHDHPPSG